MDMKLRSNMKTVCSCVLVLILHIVYGQYSTTPCPGVFDFVSDGQHVYGKITLVPVAPVHLSTLLVRINFTVAARLPNNNYVGRLDAQDSKYHLQRYNGGQPVQYIVHFPVTSPLPKLTSLTVNDDTICYGPGDIPTPYTSVSTLSLQHTSFVQGAGGQTGGFPVYNNFQHLPHIRPQRPQPANQPTVTHVHYGGNDETAHVYTFNNNEPTWNTDNSPYYVLNVTDLFTKPTQQYQPPTQPVSQPKPVYEYGEPTFQVVTPAIADPVTNRQDEFRNPSQATAAPDQPAPDTPEEDIGCGVLAGGNSVVPLIYNGNAYDRGEIPWLVAIFKNEQASLRFICGGTLVSNRHILTAAHCMKRRASITSIQDIVVKVGVHNLNDWGDDGITVTLQLKTADLHEQYNPASLRNDILMLTLNKPVKFNDYVRPACLWTGDPDLSLIVGKKGVVAGWGDQGDGYISKQGEPHMVKVPIASTNDCRASKSLFHDLTYENTLCAGDRNGSGPCIGDSGGGLFIPDNGKWTVRGVVSVSLPKDDGDRTCNLNEYVVFTDAAQFVPWITNIMSRPLTR